VAAIQSTTRIARTAAIVHERDATGVVLRSEVIGAGVEIPEWASDVGEHVLLAPGESLPDLLAGPPDRPAVFAFGSDDEEEAT
jgi:hypothetical protein